MAVLKYPSESGDMKGLYTVFQHLQHYRATVVGISDVSLHRSDPVNYKEACCSIADVLASAATQSGIMKVHRYSTDCKSRTSRFETGVYNLVRT
jgi:hypothetical protein